MSNLAGVQIHRLVLRGDTREKASLLASLDAQRWPGDDDQRIIFIKRLEVKSPWWTMASKLVQECDAEYHSAAQANTGSDDSNLIIFACEAQLIAQVIINLQRNQSPWYQQSWLAQTQVIAKPIALLLHRPVLIPDVLQQLQQQQQLTSLFAHFTDMELRQLVEEMQLFLAINPVLFARSLGSTVDDVGVDNKPGILPPVQTRWIKAMLPLLAEISSASAQQLALQLFICLGLWKFSPQQLQQPSAWVLWFRVLGENVRALNLAGAFSAKAKIFTSESAEPSADKKSAQVASMLAESVAAKSGNAAVGMSDTKDAVLPPARPLAELNAQGSIPQGHEQVATTGPAQCEQSEFNTPLTYRYIRHAGFLYLLNWLRNYPALVNLPVPLSPWLWIAQLYAECCSVWQLPPDKSLQQLLVEISGLDDIELHQATNLFPTAEVRAARMYLQARLEKFQIDDYSWVNVPARVWVEQGYIQIYIHEACVRLALRLAGLDINPGWVPVLGRVIQFHFGHYPELPAAEGGLPNE